jgi:transcriptional regulator with XRE-family HTH domain
MNLGRAILELRKKNNITQEDLAAELGVTAAAVSKWENGYTLPDVLMLCALADHFHISTDELLGRNVMRKQAIVVAKKEALGREIVKLAAKYDIHTCAVFTELESAQAYEAAHKDGIQYMFTAVDHPLEESEMDNANGIIHINIHQTGDSEEAVLNGIELYLKNEDAFKTLANGNK